MVLKFNLKEKILKYKQIKSNSYLISPLKCSIFKPID